MGVLVDEHHKTNYCESLAIYGALLLSLGLNSKADDSIVDVVYGKLKGIL